jgi:hypothetical protein
VHDSLYDVIKTPGYTCFYANSFKHDENVMNKNQTDWD